MKIVCILALVALSALTACTSAAPRSDASGDPVQAVQMNQAADSKVTAEPGPAVQALAGQWHEMALEKAQAMMGGTDNVLLVVDIAMRNTAEMKLKLSQELTARGCSPAYIEKYTGLMESGIRGMVAEEILKSRASGQKVSPRSVPSRRGEPDRNLVAAAL